ncbi:MAG TPA: hypothetical protein DIS66_01480 [Candidatus Omnitrophica bacterium]|nr:hypothetical protein [Candidatus Omnitrophota bacterium]
MKIDWAVIATIASPIIALFLGALLNRVIECKARLIAYFSHSAAFNLTGNSPVTVHTHGIVLKNTGKKPAVDVRIRHHTLPRDFRVYPVLEHRVENIPSGGAEIVFPTLVPNEQVSISYLYFPPLLYSQIHAGIRHSEGFATEVVALPTPQYPWWLQKTLWFLLTLGSISSLYLFWKAIVFLGPVFEWLKDKG